VLVRIIVAGLMIGLIAGTSLAQERTAGGEVILTPTWADVQGNRAKFNEYRDLRDGVRAQVDLRLEGEKTYFQFQAGDLGYRDRKVELEGGSRGTFHYHLSYDEIPHNLTFGPSVHRQ
jgi:hypothetical protein